MYTCFACVIGLKLPVNSVIHFNDYIITNIPALIFSLYVPDQTDYTMKFGLIHYSRITQGRTFMIFKTELNNHTDPHIPMQLASQTLMQLWRIKDNSIYIDDFCFYLTNGPLCNITKFNYNIYTSKGSVEDTEFTEDDLTKCPIYFDQLSNFMTPKDMIITKEQVPSVHIHLSHKQQEYNESYKVERAMKFHWKARSESSLPLKITNYISFLECLFSPNGVELQHQVSERVALFLYKYDKSINKLETFKLIKHCYGIRSKYVHGDKLDKKFKTLESLQAVSEGLDEVCRKIINNIMDNNLVIFNEDDLTSYFLDLLFNDN